MDLETPQHISELNSAIAFSRLKNVIALFCSEMCWGVSKSTSHPKTVKSIIAIEVNHCFRGIVAPGRDRSIGLPRERTRAPRPQVALAQLNCFYCFDCILRLKNTIASKKFCLVPRGNMSICTRHNEATEKTDQQSNDKQGTKTQKGP